jgi:hypothetical protein
MQILSKGFFRTGEPLYATSLPSTTGKSDFRGKGLMEWGKSGPGGPGSGELQDQTALSWFFLLETNRLSVLVCAKSRLLE